MNLNLRFQVGISALAFVFGLLFISAPAWAVAPCEGVPGRAPGMKQSPMSPGEFWQNPKTVKELGLTDEQRRKLRDADFSFKEILMKLKCERDSLHLQMEKAFSAEKVDEESVRQAARKIADLTGELFIQHIELLLVTEQVLTLEQRTKLKVLEFGGRPKRMSPREGQPARGPHPPFRSAFP